jgi:hypothetical protein
VRLLTLLLPIVVGLVLTFVWASARLDDPAEELPSITPASPPAFEPLTAPRGNSVLEGRVLDASGRPVADASVHLRAHGAPRWTFTNQAGRFRLEALPAEELDLVVVAWPLPLGRFSRTPGGLPVELQLDPPEAPPPVLPDVAYAPVTGRVLGAGSAWGDPNGYEVVFTPERAPEVLQGPVERRVATDAAGAFELADLALGPYRVQVLPAWARGGTWPDLAASWSSDYRHARAGELEVQLTAGAIEGRLWGDRSFKPVEGAFCLVVDARDPARIWPPVVSGPDGRFRVRTLPPGPYLLSARAGEGVLVDIPVEVRAGEIARPDLEPLRIRRE